MEDKRDQGSKMACQETSIRYLRGHKSAGVLSNVGLAVEYVILY